MAITLREGLGRKLTIAEMDENFTFLSSSYVVNSITSSMVAGNADSASVTARATTLSVDATASFADLASDSRTSDSASVAARATTLSADATASIADTATTASHTAGTASIADLATLLSTDATASQADRATTASIADELKTGLIISASEVDITGNLNVEGTASFAYLQSITGSAKIIGDAFIILNNDTPTQRFAGMKVRDSGSTDDTASFVYDGDSHDWKYEYEAGAGGDHEAAVALFGPVMSDLTGSIYPVSESLVIGTGGHHLTSSTITVSNFTASMGGLFSGSFEGDGSQLSGISSYTVANSANNRILTSVDSSNGNAEANLTFDGSTLTVAGTINETSAARYKENIQPIENSLSKVIQLNPVEYDWKRDGKHDLGLIAEEVYEILPDLVSKEGRWVQGISYSRLTAVLIGAVKELAARVEELENK